MSDAHAAVFDSETLQSLFPESRADAFFEALFGDAAEGAYDISLAYLGGQNGSLDFEFRLKQRPGHCLKCSLTYGLPQVFSRHPVIGVQRLAADAAKLAGWNGEVPGVILGQTRTVSEDLHAIPLTIRRNAS